jgi:hypothetical protein
MTLITRLSTTFTDTTLPILQKDPVIPSAGAVVLYDFKNPGTWPDQTSPITSYSSLVNNNWPTLSPTPTPAQHTYNSTSGRITPLDTATASFGFPVEDASTRLFADLTANYCISMWLYKPATATGPFDIGYFARNASGGTPNNAEHSLIVRINPDTNQIQIQRPDAFFTSNSVTLSAPGNAVSRVGYAWSKNSGTWQHKGILNNGSPTAYVDSTFGTGANGIKDNAAWTGRLFGAYGFASADSAQGIYRFYVENLTLSGRTPEEVWDADWARGNGRYS